VQQPWHEESQTHWPIVAGLQSSPDVHMPHALPPVPHSVIDCDA
jgi:hypothetical protein